MQSSSRRAYSHRISYNRSSFVSGVRAKRPTMSLGRMMESPWAAPLESLEVSRLLLSKRSIVFIFTCPCWHSSAPLFVLVEASLTLWVSFQAMEVRQALR